MVRAASRSRYPQLPVKHPSSRPGYVFLLAVLGVGVIAASTSLSLMLLGWAAEQNGRALEVGAQALANAHACAERALHALREDSGYGGGEAVVLAQGSCTIHPPCGSGNADRLLQVTGGQGEALRRIEIDIAELLPATRVRSWKNVISFSACP